MPYPPSRISSVDFSFPFLWSTNRQVGAFVDFKKAFDSIPRHKLFQKLLDYKINGKFYHCLVNIYSNDISCIKIADQITPTFIANQGVKQGCILSPLLFNIYLADLAKILDDKPQPTKTFPYPSTIFWADDIAIISESEKD